MLSRALWGLLNTCRRIETVAKKEDEKNQVIIQACQQRLKEIYAKSKVQGVANMKLMQVNQ